MFELKCFLITFYQHKVFFFLSHHKGLLLTALRDYSCRFGGPCGYWDQTHVELYAKWTLYLLYYHPSLHNILLVEGNLTEVFSTLFLIFLFIQIQYTLSFMLHSSARSHFLFLWKFFVPNLKLMFCKNFVFMSPLVIEIKDRDHILFLFPL